MKPLTNHLLKLITDNRKELFLSNLEKRTKYLTVVLENIYQPLNASAVLRSCDCFGVQDVHVIENYNEFSPDTEVSMGSSNWLSIHRYNQKENNTANCIRALKKDGYRIIAACPDETKKTIEEFDLSKGKTALFFGAEVDGLSATVLDEADECITIPMFGFTESFNLSVSAAICLYQMRMKLEQNRINWQLNDEDKNQVLLEWLRYSIDRCEIIEKDFYENRLGR